MRIGLITPGFSASQDDWCVPALYDMVRALAQDDEVTVFALRYPHATTPYDFFGARVVPLGTAQRRGAKRLAMGWRALRAIRRHGPFDVLHALWAHEPGFLAALAGRLSGTPMVASILGGELEDLSAIGYGGERGRLNRRLVRYALRRASRVTVGSAGLRHKAAARVDAGRLVLAPLGVDLERFAPAPAADDPQLAGRPAILSVGSLVPVKDPATLLAACARLRGDHPDLHLHLVGDGPLRPALAGRAAELGMTDRLHLHGAVDHGRLAGYYRRADLLAVSSLFESQGMAMLEAAACGCPVAGAAVGLLPELAPEMTSPPGDAPALAAALARALAAPRRPRAIRARAAAFGLAAAMRRWRTLYAGLYDPSGPS